ncbi:MAG: zinc ribbon domain-containing protein [Clostridia bacterium]|nr:zinc ribbon domain-containing protein [Clostridia bacterium]
MFCPKCGNQVHDEAVVCVHCGCSIGNSNNSPAVKDEISFGLCFLAFLIPLFGIIYWGVMHSKTPKRAKACGLTGLITWIVSFILLMAM